MPKTLPQNHNVLQTVAAPFGAALFWLLFLLPLVPLEESREGFQGGLTDAVVRLLLLLRLARDLNLPS